MRYIILAFILFFTGCSTRYSDLKTVKSVDLLKYKGLWYEIARYENSFEKGCIGATAEYTLKNEKVLVINRCYDKNGKLIALANGTAYSKNRNNTKLKVSFFWPFYGDYWIVKLSDDYRYSIVSEPRRKYLWILAREKNLKEKDKKEILAFLEANNFNISSLYWTKLEGIKYGRDK